MEWEWEIDNFESIPYDVNRTEKDKDCINHFPLDSRLRKSVLKYEIYKDRKFYLAQGGIYDLKDPSKVILKINDPYTSDFIINEERNCLYLSTISNISKYDIEIKDNKVVLTINQDFTHELKDISNIKMKLDPTGTKIGCVYVKVIKGFDHRFYPYTRNVNKYNIGVYYIILDQNGIIVDRQKPRPLFMSLGDEYDIMNTLPIMQVDIYSINKNIDFYWNSRGTHISIAEQLSGGLSIYAVEMSDRNMKDYSNLSKFVIYKKRTTTYDDKLKKAVDSDPNVTAAKIKLDESTENMRLNNDKLDKASSALAEARVANHNVEFLSKKAKDLNLLTELKNLNIKKSDKEKVISTLNTYKEAAAAYEKSAQYHVKVSKDAIAAESAAISANQATNVDDDEYYNNVAYSRRAQDIALEAKKDKQAAFKESEEFKDALEKAARAASDAFLNAIKPVVDNYYVISEKAKKEADAKEAEIIPINTIKSDAVILLKSKEKKNRELQTPTSDFDAAIKEYKKLYEEYSKKYTELSQKYLKDKDLPSNELNDFENLRRELNTATAAATAAATADLGAATAYLDATIKESKKLYQKYLEANILANNFNEFIKTANSFKLTIDELKNLMETVTVYKTAYDKATEDYEKAEEDYHKAKIAYSKADATFRRVREKVRETISGDDEYNAKSKKDAETAHYAKVAKDQYSFSTIPFDKVTETPMITSTCFKKYLEWSPTDENIFAYINPQIINIIYLWDLKEKKSIKVGIHNRVSSISWLADGKLKTSSTSKIIIWKKKIGNQRRGVRSAPGNRSTSSKIPQNRALSLSASRTPPKTQRSPPPAASRSSASSSRTSPAASRSSASISRTSPAASRSSASSPKPSPPASRSSASSPKPSPPATGSSPRTASPATGSSPRTASPATGSIPRTASPATGSSPRTASPATGSSPRTASPAASSSPKQKTGGKVVSSSLKQKSRSPPVSTKKAKPKQKAVSSKK